MQPKGSIVVECGNALLKNGYKLKILNTINFKKSMQTKLRRNPSICVLAKPRSPRMKHPA